MKPLLLLLVALIAVAFVAGYGCSQLLSPSVPTEDLDLVGEAWHIVFQDFVDRGSLHPEELRRGAIEGMLEALDDPWAAYLEPEEVELWQSGLEGGFSGIGAVVSMEDDQLTVVSPIMGSPAERAGVRAGDKILEIDGQSTEGMSLVDAVLRIRGEEGTRVTLSVLHPQAETTEEIAITRERIILDSVAWEMLPQSIAHLRISQFSARTAGELTAALEEIGEEGAMAIVLDLRNNPGGLVDAAVAVASQFLPAEAGHVFSAVDGQGNVQKWEIKPGGLAVELPLAVLVNEGSASGSEIVAGAVQDYGQGPLIGSKTIGKGSVNLLRTLSDGSAIYLTIARWYTPGGHLIEGQGLSPDIVVEAGDGETDPQLEQAIEYLKGQL